MTRYYLWADLTGSPGSQPKAEGARDHVTSRSLPISPPPPPLRPPASSPPKFSLIVYHSVFIYMKMHFFSHFQLSPGQTCCPCPKWTSRRVLDWGLGAGKLLGKIQNFWNASDVAAATCLPLFLLCRQTFGWWFAARE